MLSATVALIAEILVSIAAGSALFMGIAILVTNLRTGVKENSPGIWAMAWFACAIAIKIVNHK